MRLQHLWNLGSKRTPETLFLDRSYPDEDKCYMDLGFKVTSMNSCFGRKEVEPIKGCDNKSQS